jgi:hypothetical protein
MAWENDGKVPSYLHDELGAAYTPPVLNEVGAELYVAMLAVDGSGRGAFLRPEEAAPAEATMTLRYCLEDGPEGATNVGSANVGCP